VRYLVFLILILPLFIPISLASIPHPSSQYIYFNVSLSEGYKIVVVSYSNQTFPLLIFTPTQFMYWIKNLTTSAIVVTNISKGNYSFYLPQGNYIVVIDGYKNSYPSPQNYKLYTIPYNVYALITQPKNDSAIGIAAYGVSNKSSCVITTNAILGYFNISSIYAYNSTFYMHYGASLQLNAVLRGGNQSLFLQNVISFITNKNILQFVTNIWNLTSPLASLNSSFFYFNSTSYSTYRLPFAGYLIINVSNVSNGVKISFGYIIIQNGSIIEPMVRFFTTAYFPFKGYILVDPFNLTGNYHAYDTEFVFGGYEDGEITTFISLNATLALYYNSTYGWTPFRSIYTYGVNTGEGVTNLHVSLIHGYANVYVGNETLSLLTTHFNPSNPYLLYIRVLPYNYSFYVNSSYKIYFPENISSKYEVARLNSIYVNGVKVENGYIISYSTLPKVVEIYVNYTYYFYVSIILPNGSILRGWYSNGSKITLPKEIYFNNNERYILTTNTVYVQQPLINYTPKYIKQFKVMVDNSTYWVNQGSNITLYSPTFLILTVKWIGTYNVTNGATVEVTSPIVEKEIIGINYVNLCIILVLVIALVWLIKRILS